MAKQLSQSYRTGKLALVDVAVPHAPADGVMVETRASLISAGTERSVVQLARKSLLEKARERPDLVAKVFEKLKKDGALATFESVRTKLDAPIPLGYSMAGRVREVGRLCREFKVGDRVACAGAGYANHADFDVVPRNLVVPIPDAVTDEEASFVTVGAIALHGIRLLRAQLGDVVVVVGLGLIGQISVQLLAAQGADVIGVDVDRSKVDLAISRGAVAACTTADDVQALVASRSNGRGADSVLITASAPDNSPLVLAGDVARDRARVSVVGLLPMEVPRKTFFEKELELVISRSYGPGRYDPEYEERGKDYPVGYVRWTERNNLAAVLRAIETKRLDVKSLITHRFAFEDVLSAYEIVSGDRPEPHLGIILQYAEKAPEPQVPPSSGGQRPLVGQREVGLAVVGTGNFATGVLVPALEKIAGARLAAAVSGRGLSAAHVAASTGARVTASLDEAINAPDVAAVVLATRHATHARDAARVLAAGKHVFVEKPAAIDLQQLKDLDAAVSASQAIFMVGFNRRFAPFAREVAEHFGQMPGGIVLSARVNAGSVPASSWIVARDEGGGRIVGEGCHFVDLLSYWAGADPVAVSAHSIGGGAGYDRDDNIVVSIRFANGSVGQLTYTAMGDPSFGKERFEIFGGGSAAVIDDWRTLVISSRGKRKTRRALRPEKGHREELEAFVAACRNGGPSPIAWSSIRATTNATFAIEAAAEHGIVVEL